MDVGNRILESGEMIKIKMFLTPGEMQELTNRIHHSKQVLVLRSMGIEHRTRPDGSVAVLRQHVEQTLGIVVTKRKVMSTEPNWGSLNATHA